MHTQLTESIDLITKKELQLSLGLQKMVKSENTTLLSTIQYQMSYKNIYSEESTEG